MANNSNPQSNGNNVATEETLFPQSSFLDQQESLQNTVAEARQIIGADRVVIYSLDQQSQGQILAESVDARYPQALGVIIDDLCMSTYYLEKYQNGRIQALDDIEQANLNPCYLAQLKAFAVKANLVVPILARRQIIGLLIAHHCAAPHAWQPWEMDVIVQIATQIGSALDYFKLLKTGINIKRKNKPRLERARRSFLAQQANLCLA